MAFIQNLDRGSCPFPANQPFINNLTTTIPAGSFISLVNPTFNSNGQVEVSGLAAANTERVGYVESAVAPGNIATALLKGDIKNIDTDAFSVGDRLKTAGNSGFAVATKSSDNVVARVTAKSMTIGSIYFDGESLNKELVSTFLNSTGDRFIKIFNNTGATIGNGRFVPLDLTVDKVNGATPITADVVVNQQFAARTLGSVADQTEATALIEGTIRFLNFSTQFYTVGDQLKISTSSVIVSVTSGTDNVIGEVLEVNDSSNNAVGAMYFNGQHIDFHPPAIVHDYGFLGFDAEFNGGSGNTDSDFPNITIAAAATSAKLGFVGLSVGDLTPFGLGETISNTTTGTFRVVSAGRYRIEVPELRYSYNTTAIGDIITSITMTGRTSSGTEVDLYTIHDDSVTHTGSETQTNIIVLPRVIVADLAATDTIRFYMNIENSTASSITLTNNSAQNFIEFRAAEVSIELLQLL